MPSLNPKTRGAMGTSATPRDIAKRTRRGENRSNKQIHSTLGKPKKGGVSSDVPTVKLQPPPVACATTPPPAPNPKPNTDHKYPSPLFLAMEDQKKRKNMERMKDQKETKGKRRKSDEKAKEEEKKPPVPRLAPTRGSKKKTTTSTSSEAKTEEYSLFQPVPKSKSRKKQSGSAEVLEKEKSAENKSSNSKERSETEERELEVKNKEKKMKKEKEAAQKFFKELKVQKQTAPPPPKRGFVESLRLEVMPESSHLNQSIRAMKKKLNLDKSMFMKISIEVPEKTEPSNELTEIFKPNGDPFWVVPERQPGDPVERTEDGTVIENPELAKALAEEDLKIEETLWADTVNEYLDNKIPSGQLMERSQQMELDPFAELDELNKNCDYMSAETVNYLTAKTLHEMCYEAVNRFERKRIGYLDMPERKPRSMSKESDANPIELVMKPSEFIEPTKIVQVTSVNFEMKKTVYYRYDRRCPIASAQALTKKLHASSTAGSGETESKEETKDIA